MRWCVVSVGLNGDCAGEGEGEGEPLDRAFLEGVREARRDAILQYNYGTAMGIESSVACAIFACPFVTVCL